MKILFICTAFNSLAQRTALVLRSRGHAVTIEYALSPSLMISAATLSSPDLIICPFLTKHVPPEIYNNYLTLIVHPGPPGDAGPSAIDWCLIGDMGELEDADSQLALIDAKHSAKGARATMRSHWGVTVLQAIEAFDAGPVWAFDQFELKGEWSVLSTLLGTPLFLYNAHVQRDLLPPSIAARQTALNTPGTILATREGAILVDVGADYPLWIGHLRRPKAKNDKYLHPKLAATMALLSLPETAAKLSLLDTQKVPEWSPTTGFGSDPLQPYARRPGTYQQVWIDVETSPLTSSKVAYIHAEFYNGAFSTLQCTLLLSAIRHTLLLPNLKAVVLLGGSGYFSNGIALNVIEGSTDPSAEGWANINAIDDCVQALLAPKGVVTFAAMRGNAAAGGLAMATAADFVISTESAVLNPHYRGLGLYGSEWHTYSWYERCGESVANKFAREMLPMSATEAKQVGLVDYVLNNDRLSSHEVLTSIKNLVNQVMDANVGTAEGIVGTGAPWTRSLRPASADASQTTLLSDQILRNKTRYLAYLFAENSSTGPMSLEEHFLRYRKQELDQMKLDFFHPHRNQRFASRCTGFVRKLVPSSTPTRFALHRRYSDWSAPSPQPKEVDEEEKEEFDGLAGIPAAAAVARLPEQHPELVPPMKEEEVSRQDRAYSVGQDTLASSRGARGEGEATLKQTGSQRSSMSTAPTTPGEGSSKPVLSLGDEEAQRVEIEAEQLKVSPLRPTDLASLANQAAIKCGPTAISFAASGGAVGGGGVDKPRAPAARPTRTANR
ncbi:hypothetical protein NDA16_001893 [Ustilago loliicola]|nr:hypothetical protein NDA16_001893 [Ustilago loliicola]